MTAPAPGNRNDERGNENTARDFDQLVTRYLDDQLTAEEHAALAELLRGHPDRQRTLIELTLVRRTLHEAVARNAKRGPRTAEAPTPPARPASAGRRTASEIPNAYVYATAALVAIATVIVGIYLYVSSLPHSETPDPTSTAPLANLIENASEGTLTTPGGFISEGRDYGRGTYALDRGTAEFMLTNSVNVKLRGETRMHMRSDMNVALTRGEAAFVVPADATGFTVHLPDGSKVVDLGTTFRVIVDSDGSADVAMLDGRARVVRANGEATVISREGLARLRVSEQGFTPVATVEHIDEAWDTTAQFRGLQDGAFFGDATEHVAAINFTAYADRSPIAIENGGAVAGGTLNGVAFHDVVLLNADGSPTGAAAGRNGVAHASFRAGVTFDYTAVYEDSPRNLVDESIDGADSDVANRVARSSVLVTPDRTLSLRLHGLEPNARVYVQLWGGVDTVTEPWLGVVTVNVNGVDRIDWDTQDDAPWVASLFGFVTSADASGTLSVELIKSANMSVGGFAVQQARPEAGDSSTSQFPQSPTPVNSPRDPERDPLPVQEHRS